MAPPIKTQNHHGFTYQLTFIGHRFLRSARESALPVLDVGCAYGVATVEALRQGSRVVALDIDQSHLDAVEGRALAEHRSRLSLIRAEFPDVDFPPESFHAVYISQVFPFLTGTAIEQAVRKVHQWLETGGKVFVVTFTPFLGYCASYLDEYESKRRDGDPWPGYVANLSAYSRNASITDQLPQSIHHLDRPTLRRVFSPFFDFEYLDYLDNQDGLPPELLYDGRERVGLIGTKRAR